MTTLDAHEHFAAIADRASHDFAITVATIDDVDVWPAIQAACASLSGQLDTCETLSDLVAAVRHYETLVDIGAAGPEALSAEVNDVLTALMEWGDRLESATAAPGPPPFDPSWN